MTGLADTFRGFFSLPMTAGDRDRRVGTDELGRAVMETPMGDQYTVTEAAPINIAEAAREFTGQVRQDPVGSIGQVATALAQGAWNGIEAPGNALRGEAQTYGDVADTALDWGIMGAAGRAPEGSLRIFAGRNARTADTAALEAAQRLAAEGASRDEIWRNTGWFQGVDGQWRFEIDDSAAGITDRAYNMVGANEAYGTNFRGAFDHPELMRAYDGVAPFDGDVDFRLSTNLSGGYYPDNDAIRVAADARDDFRSVGLHEIQHAVQNREGFGRGGNPGDATTDLLLERNAAMREIVDAMDARQAELGLSGYRPQTNDPVLRRLREQYDSMVGRTIPDEDVLARYRAYSGEVEARNVQTRADFTPEQRRATPPWETADVPEADQIVRFGSGPQASIPETPAQQVARLLREGRASEVTDDLMAQVDAQEMYRLYESGATGQPMPMDEASRMARAQEMGFDTETPLYHGTAADIEAFRLSDRGMLGPGAYFANRPELASRYSPDDGGSIIAAYAPDNFAPQDVREAAGAARRAAGTGPEGTQAFIGAMQGYSGNRPPMNTTQLTIVDPTAIRSRFARFDPRLRHLANLSAGAAGAGIALPYLTDDREQTLAALQAYMERVQ